MPSRAGTTGVAGLSAAADFPFANIASVCASNAAARFFSSLSESIFFQPGIRFPGWLKRQELYRKPCGRRLVLFLGVFLFLRFGHLLRETGGVFRVLLAVDGERAAHVVGILHLPSLTGVVERQI